MLYDYGFVEGHLGEDDEQFDCYVGPDESAPEVHVVHQLRAPDFKAHDEMKVFLGFPDAAAAKAAFLAHRNDEGAFGAMTTFPLERFRAKLSRRSPRSTSRIRATAPRAGAVKLRARGSGRVESYIDQLDAAAARRGAAAWGTSRPAPQGRSTTTRQSPRPSGGRGSWPTYRGARACSTDSERHDVSIRSRRRAPKEGNLVPMNACWLAALLKDLADFTGVNDATDDQVDALSHASNETNAVRTVFRGNPVPGAGRRI
jgi:inorganic pyrophosphatase-like protein